MSCFYHDAAACLLRDGEIVAAAEEERFTRRKHDSRFPENAIDFCLEEGGIGPDEVDLVVFYERPLRKFERILSTCAATYPRSRHLFVRAMEAWLGEKLWVGPRMRAALGYRGFVLFTEHHVAHAASAYFPSPFDEAAVVTADGVGEWTTATIGHGVGERFELIEEIHFPHSLGLLYSAFTAYLGFEVNEGEYKVMGMSAYGRPRHVDKVKRMIDLAGDGSFRLDMRFFTYQHSLKAISRHFVELFGPPRSAESGIEEHYADIAASIQAVTEEAMLGLVRRARERTGSRYLCLAGGVALNVLANTRILGEAGFDDVWIQPAAGDSGGAIGAAAYVHHTVLGNRERHPMRTAYLGPAFGCDRIDDFLTSNDIAYERLADDQIAPATASLLARGEVVGWFQGRMEFGPRALGARSILADPTDPGMKERVNEKIKHREPFRPFAPSVLEGQVDRHFDIAGRAGRPSPFMLFVGDVRPASKDLLPAITHVDGTARVQTVAAADNGLYHDLIARFGELKAVPVLLNTSFNLRGEPIVCTPEDAFNTFSHSGMDHLVLGNALIPASSKKLLRPYPGSRTSGDEVIV